MKDVLKFMLLVTLAGYAIMIVFFAQKQIGVYYPYVDDLDIFYQSPGYFGTHAGCREWARSQARASDNGRSGLYACAKKCEYIQDQEYFACNKISRPEPLYSDTDSQ